MDEQISGTNVYRSGRQGDAIRSSVPASMITLATSPGSNRGHEDRLSLPPLKFGFTSCTSSPDITAEAE